MNVYFDHTERGNVGVAIKSLKNSPAYLKLEALENKHLMFDNDDNFGSFQTSKIFVISFSLFSQKNATCRVGPVWWSLCGSDGGIEGLRDPLPGLGRGQAVGVGADPPGDLRGLGLAHRRSLGPARTPERRQRGLVTPQILLGAQQHNLHRVALRF